jgi:alkanesulfonate monooxygenase SsuD/methylene tetrahydromethanopterin reductase-like flavin-dependent oxidoreductase (luciferase family)
MNEHVPPDRRATWVFGDPDSVGEQCRDLLDAGLDGLIFNCPYVHEPEMVQLAGETLSSLVAERVR